MKSQDIRDTFLTFFESKQHTIVPSAPMVLKDDPTLMFVNSGMAPFKEYFLGNGTPKSNRLTDSQKCLRVSGKHNDLEEVGYDTYHHTLFEMLGNWSFGDYFKKEAIAWAWELLTEVYKIDKNILYVTVFEGDKADNTPMDQEAYDFWKAIIPEDRILMGNKKDNFWEMGDQGPCGPCSEIHVDIRSDEEKEKVDGKTLVNEDHPQVVEIWNLVFMQYNRKANGSLKNLPAKHIDTGMGFERLCMVLQGVQSNYDTDVFTPLIREIETITNTDYGKDGKVDVAIRVISDHVRAVAFSIADGQLPSNNGAGYVIRRILRRAVRYGFTFLDKKEPFIYRLVDVLVKKMGKAFPELKSQKQLIENVIKEEEASFLRTLERGINMLESHIGQAEVVYENMELLTEPSRIVSGKIAFELLDTYGFPLDLTQLISREKGWSVDIVGFEKLMTEQKNRSRKASEIKTDDWIILVPSIKDHFVGYDELSVNTRILRYREVESSKLGMHYQIVLENTPFYPEGGGQIGDMGTIKSTDGKEIYKVFKTSKEDNLIIHYLATGNIKLNRSFFESPIVASVNENLRKITESNHTATHLLHQALRNVLGNHVEQKGSSVNFSNLRFDFSHFSKLTEEELQSVENFVNARISQELELEERREVSYKEAIQKGAIALFGEKYSDTVRTIKFGDSIELCGGTHVDNTKDLWYFKIISEGAVASGIRRIEAITSQKAKEFFINNNRAYFEMKNLLNAQEPVKALQSLQEENSELKKQVESLLKDKAKSLKGDLINELEEINGITFLAKRVDLDMSGIKDLSFELGSQFNNVFLLFGTEQEGKAMLSCYISKDVVTNKGLNAGNIVRELGKFIQGGGGGQPFYATAGGKNPDGISKALEQAKDYLK